MVLCVIFLDLFAYIGRFTSCPLPIGLAKTSAESNCEYGSTLFANGTSIHDHPSIFHLTFTITSSKA
jgi:hypothetical protein